ncbi:putative F-box domain-containing protein [Tanacetum coccineum]
MEVVGDDMVEQILLRSDVRDLIPCKAVCKSWLSLISDPLFIKKHLVQSYNKDHLNNVSRRIVMISLPNGISFILGSSNGLVCLITPDAKHIYVINPSIRHIKQLPGDLPITIPEISRLCSGFGYDSVNDDYKVILGDETCFHVFSLKSNVWKVVEFSKHYKFISNVGVLYNGSLHWFTEDDNKEVSIVSFDVSRQEFKEIPQPDDPRYEWQPYRRLGIMNGCLSIYNYGFGHDDNIWMMNNYNVKHSWEMYLHYHNRECQVIHSLYESNIPSEGAQKIFGQVIWDLMTHKYVCASVFVESLVSPHVQGKQ